jgi:hypothetical protein
MKIIQGGPPKSHFANQLTGKVDIGIFHTCHHFLMGARGQNFLVIYQI